MFYHSYSHNTSIFWAIKKLKSKQLVSLIYNKKSSIICSSTMVYSPILAKSSKFCDLGTGIALAAASMYLTCKVTKQVFQRKKSYYENPTSWEDVLYDSMEKFGAAMCASLTFKLVGYCLEFTNENQLLH